MNRLREQLFAYVKKTYGVEPDYPFSTLPECPVLRHKDNRKWFALCMEIPRERLGLSGEGRVDAVDLKCPSALAGSLRRQEGYLPGYHMNRDNWITVLLDGTVPLEDLLPLIDLSWQLTADKKARPGRKSWLAPANPRYYDLEAVLAASPDKTFLWKQSSAVKKGDTVYLYVAAPVSGIRYRCRAVEVDIPFSFANEQVRMSRVMRLKLQKTYRTPIGRDVLAAHGVTTVRGPRYMPESLIEEIDGKPGR